MNTPLPSDRESDTRAVAPERLEMLARLERSEFWDFRRRALHRQMRCDAYAGCRFL